MMKSFRVTPSITSRDEADSVNKYLFDVSKLKTVTPDEEFELAIKIKDGDTKAADELIKANLRFVISVAKKYQHQGLPLIDLINEGNFGLTKAAYKFDPTKGFKFITYAVWWIRQSILEALAENSRIVRLPVNKINEIMKYKELLEKQEQILCRQPTIEDLDEIGIDPDLAKNIFSFNSKNSYFDGCVDGDNDCSLISITVDEDALPPDELSINSDLKNSIKSCLCILKEKEKIILEMNFGIDRPEMTLSDIAEYFGVSVENIRQTKKKSLIKLKHKMGNYLKTQI